MQTVRIIQLWLLVLAMSASAGCNVLGWASSAVSGESKIPATYTPAKEPMVVIAENFSGSAGTSMDGEPIARYITDELAAHEVSPTINPDRVTRLQIENPSKFRGMTIAAVGREVGASQILYVNIINVGVNFADNSDLIKGRGEVRVRLVDANTGGTIWPRDAADGFPVAAETNIVRSSERSETVVRSDVHRALANRVARLFYAVKGG